MTLLISTLDGTLAYITGGGAWVMANTPLLVGSIAAAYGYFHVAYRLEPGHGLYATRPWLHGLGLLMLSLLPMFLLVPALIPNLVPLYMVLNTGMLLVFAVQVLPPITWKNLSKAQHRAAIIWPLIIGAVAVGSYGVHFAGAGFDQTTLDLVNRVLLGLNTAHVFYFVCLSVREQMQATVAAQQAALEAARETVEAELAIERSERNFERARAIADDCSRQLASASHDIKQPIAALRQAATRMAAETPGEQDRVIGAINYLDQLAGSYLQLGNSSLDTQDYEVDIQQGDRERLDVELILRTVATLHGEEAANRGMTLRMRATPVQILVAPLALTRTISNLLANALVHSGGSTVLLIARKRGPGVRIEVHDNGRGMTAEELRSAAELRHRGQDSPGSGLGLSIIQAQADEYGWHFFLRSRPSHGSSAYLTIE